MKRAALGVRMHSGWGVVVAVSADPDPVDVVDRRRIVAADAKTRGASQPYHHAAGLGLAEAEKYLANCAAISERMALAAVEEIVRELGGRQYRVLGSVVLMASGRPLPSLSKILASHALIHTAEGEFFRAAVWKACERLGVHVTAIRESELNEQAKAVFGNAAGKVQSRISKLGGSIGPPWTKDHKTAALAAAVILARRSADL